MPPGKGFYGPKYREKRSGDRKLAPFALLAGVPVLAFLAWIGASLDKSAPFSDEEERELLDESNY